jgi:hypothetical protein
MRARATIAVLSVATAAPSVVLAVEATDGGDGGAVRATRPAAAAAPALRLDVEAHKRRVVQGEPIVLRITLRNTGSRTVTADLPLEARFDRLRVLFGPSGAGPRVLLTPALEVAANKKQAPPPAVRLGPGRVLRTTRTIAFDAARLDLVTAGPGRYALQAHLLFDNYRSELLSRPAAVSVRRARGRDARALRALRRAGILAFLTPEVSVLPDSIERRKLAAARRFVRRHRRSVYAPYVARVLRGLR